MTFTDRDRALRADVEFSQANAMANRIRRPLDLIAAARANHPRLDYLVHRRPTLALAAVGLILVLNRERKDGDRLFGTEQDILIAAIERTTP